MKVTREPGGTLLGSMLVLATKLSLAKVNAECVKPARERTESSRECGTAAD